MKFEPASWNYARSLAVECTMKIYSAMLYKKDSGADAANRTVVPLRVLWMVTKLKLFIMILVPRP